MVVIPDLRSYLDSSLDDEEDADLEDIAVPEELDETLRYALNSLYSLIPALDELYVQVEEEEDIDFLKPALLVVDSAMSSTEAVGGL